MTFHWKTILEHTKGDTLVLKLCRQIVNHTLDLESIQNGSASAEKIETNIEDGLAQTSILKVTHRGTTAIGTILT